MSRPSDTYLDRPNSLNAKIIHLEKLCQPINLEPEFQSYKISAISQLSEIIKRFDRHSIQSSNFREILRCSLALVYYFGMRLKQKSLTSRYWYWCEKRRFQKAETLFHKVLGILHPERCDAVIKTCLSFISDVDLWPFESFVGQILEIVLYYNGGRANLFNTMLTDIHIILFQNVKSARHRMRILYNLFKSPNWVIEKQKLLPLVTRLLDFFYYSMDKTDNKIKAYGYLRKGFEVCLRRIFERVENDHRFLIISTMLKWLSIVDMSDGDMLEFSSLLDYVAKLYKVDNYSNCIREGMLDYILCNLVGSTKALHSLIGCKLIEILLDRQNNFLFLLSPSVYYEFSQVRLKVGVKDKRDKIFIREHRHLLHDYLLKAVKHHGDSMANMKSLFSIICIIVLEVPCGLTAAAAAYLLMAIQDYALNGENIAAESRYWMHAIVISIMSLICWVHKAPILYRYVSQIICRRAKEAPQLNPPLKHYYDIGRHHVTWNKPTLFFEDWELRYGLWKHFQASKPEKIGDKVPTKVHQKKKISVESLRWI